MIDDKLIKVYTKDAFVFSGKLIKIDDILITLLDYKTDKEITIPLMNVARIEEVKQ